MAELEALLVACLSVDNEVSCRRRTAELFGHSGGACFKRAPSWCGVDAQSRRRAEEAIKVAAKKPEIVPELVDRIHSSGNPEVRQLSAVLLRKKITSLWRKLDKQVGKSLTPPIHTHTQPAIRPHTHSHTSNVQVWYGPPMLEGGENSIHNYQTSFKNPQHSSNIKHSVVTHQW
jgi:hypothetical protein